MACSIYVERELRDQLPLIARVNTPFSWTFSRDTFISDYNGTIQYTASDLPDWLAFDNSTLTLYGIPSISDEGFPEIRITAHDLADNDTATSHFTLYVTRAPAPELEISVSEQFNSSNPSLSSVFVLSPNSALATSNPTLRIPPKWSFSIGFEYDTFVADGDVFYAASQVNGSDLPDWIIFNPEQITFDGVTPQLENATASQRVSLALHASDKEGYTAAALPFDIVVAAHEMSLATSSLPTINITASTPFNISLTSPDDFVGVLIDGQPVQPSDIIDLNIDTSQYVSWLRYDDRTRTLSGQPPDDLDNGVHNPLPVALTSSVNQTLRTNVSLAIDPSFFTTANLQPILVEPGHNIQFALTPFFSNKTGLGQKADVNLTAEFDPQNAGNYLRFDPLSAQLLGTIPNNTMSAGGNYSHITVTFTAYSQVTHSTSHTKLPISLTASDYAKQHSAPMLSAVARAKLLLGLKIAFGVISGLVGLAMLLAAFRRYARVQDTAAEGDEAKRAWTADEMKWYGIGIEVGGEPYQGPENGQGYGWSEEQKSPPNSKYGNIGVSLQRVLTRTTSNHSTFLPNILSPQSPGMIRKADFVGKLKATARKVSDGYRSVSDRYRRVVGIGTEPRRPPISKPTLVMTTEPRASRLATGDINDLPIAVQEALGVRPPSHRPPLPFEDMDFGQNAPSGMTSINNSPSSSTGGRSIPRRRADFAPPKGPLPPTPPERAHTTKHAHNPSVASSTMSMASVHTHEAEAVIQTAARATSVRSAASGVSFASEDARAAALEVGRPRLVPFTSSNRVPVPKLSGDSNTQPADPSIDTTGASNKGASTKRVPSQMAKVYRGTSGAGLPPAPERSADDLSIGIEYVRALGDDLPCTCPFLKLNFLCV